jgi:protein involved in polysaccharide export with SLBB domain
MRRLLILSVALSVGFSACWFARTPETPKVAITTVTPASTLGPGDVFEVKVYDEKDLSGIYRVSSNGSINFPLIGKVRVDGMASSDVADLIQTRLGEKYLRNPQVSILVKEYNSKKVSVFGQVNKPGTFRYEDRMTVIQAVSMAGGFTKLAAKNDTNVTRIVEGDEKKFPVPVEAIAEGKAKNFALRPGDIVYVPESIW